MAKTFNGTEPVLSALLWQKRTWEFWRREKNRVLQ